MYLGFEIQVKYWWLPFWIEKGTNSYSSFQEAEEAINMIKNYKVY